MSMTRRRLLDDSFKKTVEGNPAIATDSLARMYPVIVMNGWAKQDSTTGAQLLQPLENTDKNATTVLGVSFTQDNMKFKISGTANGDGGRTTYFAKAILQPGAYYLSISKSINNLNAIISNFSTNLYIYGVGAFEVSEITEIGFGFNVTHGTIFDDEVEIMLNAGSTALPWEPYTGGAPSPSPDYPQEIVSAGTQNQETGKWEYEITITNAQTDPDKNQTVTLTADRPLTKWDRMEKRNGQWGWVYKSAKIESYTDESVPGEYYSTTGQLSTGAQVWYETTTETFVPLTASEQEAMNTLHTYRPTTVLSNQQDCEMALTYKTRKGMN